MGERIALAALAQHQRRPLVGEKVLRVLGEAGDQDEGRAVEIRGDAGERHEGVSALRIERAERADAD